MSASNPEQIFTSFLNRLSQSQKITSIAQIEINIINAIVSLPQQKFTPSMNLILQKIPNQNFEHIFQYLIQDGDFLVTYHEQIIAWLVDNLTICDNGITQLSLLKKKKVLELLLNLVAPNSSDNTNTFLNIIIESRCRTDLNFCYCLLSNINTIISQPSIIKDLNKYNLNDLTILAVRVIKNFTKLPPHLIDQALKFISKVLLSKFLHQRKELSQQMKTICEILFQKVMQILESQKYAVGNAYRFLGLVLQFYDRIDITLGSQELLKILIICSNNLTKLFPNSHQRDPKVFENQIQKITQYFCSQNQSPQQLTQQPQNQKVNQQNFSNKIKLNQRLQLLRGVSFYLNKLFGFYSASSQKQIHKEQQVIYALSITNMMAKNKQILEKLFYCNDRQIFCNFIEIYSRKDQIDNIHSVKLDFQDDALIRQIVRNSPNIHSQKQNISHCQVSGFLQTKVKQLIQKGHLSYFLQLINENIQKQYDQAFNKVEFQSACNALALILKSVKQSQNNIIEEEQQNDVKKTKKIMSKDEIIEWIKMLLNLNESCLPQYRKVIVSKTYQVLTEVYQIILPNNQYLQEVIETELLSVRPFDERKELLQKLLDFYERQGRQIFESGYKNQLEFNRLVDGSSQPITNTTLRQSRLLERAYKKLQDNSLNFQKKTHLWKVIVRILKLGDRPNESSLQSVKKMYSTRPDILFARHLVGKELQDIQIKNLLSLTKNEIEQVDKEFRKNPIFYQSQLKIIKTSL